MKSNIILLPGESVDVPTELEDQTIIAEGHGKSHWPPPQLTKVTNKAVQLTNQSSEPITLTDLKTNSIQLTKTTIQNLQNNPTEYRIASTKITLPDSDTINLIKIGETDRDTK